MSRNSQASLPLNPHSQSSDGENQAGQEVEAGMEISSAESASQLGSQTPAPSQSIGNSMQRRLAMGRRSPQPYRILPFPDDPYFQVNQAREARTYRFLEGGYIAEQEAKRNAMAGEGTSRTVMGIPTDHIRGMDTALVQHGERLGQHDQRIQQALNYVEILWENADREREQRERMQCLIILLGVVVLLLSLVLAHVLLS